MKLKKESDQVQKPKCCGGKVTCPPRVSGRARVVLGGEPLCSARRLEGQEARSIEELGIGGVGRYIPPAINFLAGSVAKAPAAQLIPAVIQTVLREETLTADTATDPPALNPIQTREKQRIAKGKKQERVLQLEGCPLRLHP